MREKRKKTYIFVIICMILFAAITGGMATYAVTAENTQDKIQNGDAPIITILTHGENEKDSIFTQGGYTSNSLFEQLCANGKTERYRLQCNFLTDSALLFKLSPPQKVGEAYLTENSMSLLTNKNNF